jgi:hypothetical protein
MRKVREEGSGFVEWEQPERENDATRLRSNEVERREERDVTPRRREERRLTRRSVEVGCEERFLTPQTPFGMTGSGYFGGA